MKPIKVSFLLLAFTFFVNVVTFITKLTLLETVLIWVVFLLKIFLKAKILDTTRIHMRPEQDLFVGRHFDTWIVAENTIKEFEKRHRFVIN